MDYLKMFNEKSFDEIIEAFLISPETFYKPQHFFIVAESFLFFEKLELAHNAVIAGLELEPNNDWGVITRFKVEKKLFNTEQAISNLYRYIFNSPKAGESVKRLLVDSAAFNCDFEKAKTINLKRTEIANNGRKKFCVAIQAFNKENTLKSVLDALMECDEKDSFAIVVIQDMYKDSDTSKYMSGWASVRNLLISYFEKLTVSFSEVSFLSNTFNLGTAPTCKKLLDYVSNQYEGFIFIEDDCILSTDALAFSKLMLEKYISSDKYPFGSCESIMFNSKNVDYSSDEIDEKLKSIDVNRFDASLFEVSFVPSTCFITKSHIWFDYSNIRSFIRGPESLNLYIKINSKVTLMPVVPRAKDIGMLDELGYSVKNLGFDGVKELKNTYYISTRKEKVLGFDFIDSSKVDELFYLTSEA